MTQLTRECPDCGNEVKLPSNPKGDEKCPDCDALLFLPIERYPTGEGKSIALLLLDLDDDSSLVLGSERGLLVAMTLRAYSNRIKDVVNEAIKSAEIDGVPKQQASRIARRIQRALLERIVD